MRKRNKILLIISCVALLVSMFCVQSFAYLTVVPEADTQSTQFVQANLPITSFTALVSDSVDYSWYNFEFHTSGVHGSELGYEDISYTNQTTGADVGRVYGTYRVESSVRESVNDLIPRTITAGTRLTTNNVVPREYFYFMIGEGVNVHSWSSDESLRRRTSLYVSSSDDVELVCTFRFDYMYSGTDNLLVPGVYQEVVNLEPIQEGNSFLYDFTPLISSCLLQVPDMAIISGGFLSVATVDGSPFDPQYITVYNQLISQIHLKQLYNIALNNGIQQTFGLFNWLGTALSGVFNVPLFYIGSAEISLGIMFLAPFAILTMIMILKMFAGG